MSKQTINIGTSPNDKSGDPLRTAFAKVNANFTELYAKAAADATDRLVNGDKELVLNVDSNTPDRAWVDFPPAFGESITIQGAEIGSTNSPMSVFGMDRVLLSTNNTVNGDRLDWYFDKTSTLTVPAMFPLTFTAVLDTAHMSSPNPAVSLNNTPWTMDVTFAIVDGQIETQVEQIFPIVSNPGYTSGYAFSFTEADHGIMGYTFDLELQDVVLPGGAGWTANIAVSAAPKLPASVTSAQTLVLHGNTGVVISNGTSIHEEKFRFEGRNLILPGNGDIRDQDGNSVLGGGGGASVTTSDVPPSSPAAGDLWYDIAGGRMYVYYDNTWIDSNPVDGAGLTVADFGEGFSLNGADKIVTNKLYSTNLTQPTQHYRLELDTNGVVHLPDQSIINGATLKSVAGNYAGITAGPAGHDEESWVWVDSDGAWVGTKYNTDQKLWHFDNNGDLTIPGEIKSAIGTGDVVIEANDGVARTWTFGGDGTTTMPAGGDTVLNGGSLYFGAINTGTNMFLDEGFNLQIYTNTGGMRSGNWIFDTNGNTTFPNGVKFDASEGNTFALDSSTISAINLRDDQGRGFYTDNGGFTIRGNGTYGWNFGIDGKLAFPDGHLTIKDSVIGRRVETVNGEAVDAIGAKLTVTDNSIAMEGYADPDGANNKVYGRLVAGTGSAIMEYVAQDIVGETSSRITVGGGITMSSGDGVIDSAWHFGMDGQTTVPRDVLFSNNKSLTVTNTISELGNIYTELQVQLNDQFYSLWGVEIGFPWGITVPLTWNSYDEFIQLSPDTIPGEGVQINITVLANNTKQAYLTWQSAFADTKITVDVNGGFVFAADSSLTLPNSAIIRQSTHEEVVAAEAAYNAAVASWEWMRIGDFLLSVNTNPGITLQGWPFAGWADVSGTTAQAYLDIVNNAWDIQNAPSSPPQQLIFYPAISASLRNQLRNALTTVISSYTAWQTLATSLDIVAGNETLSLLGNNKIEVPGIIQTTPEEDIVIRTRYTSMSSPMGEPGVYTNTDFVFGTDGSLTFPDTTVQTTAYQLTTAPGSSKGVSGNKAGMVAFDSGNFYFCKQDYTDGVADIWVKTAWTSTSW